MYASVHCTTRRDSFAKYHSISNSDSNSDSNSNSNSNNKCNSNRNSTSIVMVIVVVIIVMIVITGYGTFGLPNAVTVGRLGSLGAVYEPVG